MIFLRDDFSAQRIKKLETELIKGNRENQNLKIEIQTVKSDLKASLDDLVETKISFAKEITAHSVDILVIVHLF